MAEAKRTVKKRAAHRCSKCNRVGHNIRRCNFVRRVNVKVQNTEVIDAMTVVQENTKSENKTRLNLCCPTCGKAASLDEVVVDWSAVKGSSEQD